MKPRRLTVITPTERSDHIASSTKLALSATAAKQIQFLTLDEVRRVKSLAGHGHALGAWETSPEHFPSGTPSLWHLDLGGCIRRHLDDALERNELESVLADAWFPQLFSDALLSLSRYTLLCRLGPSALAPVGDSMDVSNIAKTAYNYTSKMAAHSIIKAIAGEASEETCFAKLSMEDLANGKNISAADQKPFSTEIRRMQHLAYGGYWSDTPVFTEILQKVTRTKSNRKAKPTAPKRKPHRPLPDAYVAEMGYKSAWLIENLGPSLLRCLKGLQGVWRTAAERNLTYTRVSERSSRYLTGATWMDSTGSPIETLPFKVNAFGEDDEKNGDEIAWPPRTFADVIGLARALQGAHLFVSSLSTAPRNGETITLHRSCVKYSRRDGRYRAHGRTYKLVRNLAGVQREWLLPDFAAHALEQQACLVTEYERLSPMTALRDPDSIPAGTHLWGRISVTKSRQEPIGSSGVNSLLRSFARSLGMELEPGGQALVVHRFRKTLARLAALALTQAPKLLQDVFGHKSIQMTLYYILADKQLAAEIEVVERELRVMAAERVITEMIAEEEAESLTSRLGAAPQGPGGPAKQRLKGAIAEHRIEVHRRGELWGANSVRELARIMTMHGRTFQYVRPGVICTKSQGQAGPCNKKKGNPESARCKSKCDYRLEEGWLRQDVDAVLADAVRFHEQESEAGRDLVAAFWAGQVRGNVTRFHDLQEKWMQHPTVRIIVLHEEPA